jgi:hypothetical protein
MGKFWHGGDCGGGGGGKGLRSEEEGDILGWWIMRFR